MATYVGNNDFRGYLNSLAQGGDQTAQQAIGQNGSLGFVNNQGQITDPQEYGGLIGGATTTPEQEQAQRQAYNDYIANAYNTYNNLNSGSTGGSGGTGGTARATDFSLFDNNTNQLNDLLGRLQPSLDQGLQKNQNEYDTQVGNSTTDKQKQVISQNQAKQSAYDTINRNAGTGYNSLAQVIGRASGRGSSAYQQLLPDVIGKDTSSKRKDATDTFGQNLSNIDTSFESVLADLLKQKKTNEDNLRSGVETQRQGIQGQLAQNAIARAQAAGQTPQQAVAAAQPYQTAINSSRDAVQNFFNQFQTPYTAQAINPNLAQYQTDRTQVNAQQQGQDANNPYASLLRKKLQGGLA